MKHLGDITQIKGSEVPIVDIVTGGSPCQDLSVAGKRAGLAGERSGLFMEQIRIIKEMREHDKQKKNSNETSGFIKPRFMVWENVPGAFSSNKGEDFRAVLEETARVAEKDAVIPRPENGKWAPSGCIMGDGWSIAWRVHDAQFWGVPQRRKRIALVADFGGGCAPEILFERKSLSGDFEESREEGQAVARNAERGIGEASKCLNTWDVQSKHIQPENGKAEALYSGECRYGGGESYVMQTKAITGIGEASATDLYNLKITGDVVTSLTCNSNATSTQPTVMQKAISFQERAGKPGGGKGILIQNERTGALSTLNNQSVVYGICSDGSNSMRSNNPHSGIYEADTSRTLDLNGGNPACNQGGMMVLFEPRSQDGVPRIHGDISPTLNTAQGGQRQPCICIEGTGSRPSHHGDGYKESETMYTLNTVEQHAVCVPNEVISANHDMRSTKFANNGKADPLTSTDYKEPPYVCYRRTYQDKTGTLSPEQHAICIENHLTDKKVSDGENVLMTMEPIALAPHVTPKIDTKGVGFTLNSRDYKDPQCVTYQEVTGTLNPGAHAGSYNGQDAYNDMLVTQSITYGLDRASYNQGINAQYDFAVDEEKIGCQTAKGPGAVCTSIVRRLTPLECERLQGYPDHWTDIGEWIDSKGKKHKDADSPRYKALGNSIALPFWQWMAERMVKVLKNEGDENPTMASLFDGIGGFPLVYYRSGCEPIWASEIEEFPIAVTKIRFPEV